MFILVPTLIFQYGEIFIQIFKDTNLSYDSQRIIISG